MFRRPRYIKPELKYADKSIGITTILPGNRTTLALSETTLTQGTSRAGRIGNSVKLYKIKGRFINYLIPTGTAATNNMLEYRVIIWSPRIDQSQAASYMNSLSYIEQADISAVTVHKEWYMKLGYPQYHFVVGSNTFSTATPYPVHITKRFSIPFPRKANFPDASSLLDVNKDVLYVSIYNQGNAANLSLAFLSTSRLFFTDS